MATYTSAVSTKVSGTSFASNANGFSFVVPANSYALFNWHLNAGSNQILVNSVQVAATFVGSIQQVSGQGVAGPGQTISIIKVGGEAAVSGLVLTNSF